MAEPILMPPERHWVCPNCSQVALTFEVIPAPRFHLCAGLRGIAAPMLLDGVKAKVEAKEREDYVGTADVQTDGEGRPIMSVVTTREDGQDCTVLAECANASTD
jgi:hypothetical protein